MEQKNDQMFLYIKLALNLSVLMLGQQTRIDNFTSIHSWHSVKIFMKLCKVLVAFLCRIPIKDSLQLVYVSQFLKEL